MCLGIPDEYEYMAPDLVRLLKAKVPRYLPSVRIRGSERLGGAATCAGSVMVHVRPCLHQIRMIRALRSRLLILGLILAPSFAYAAEAGSSEAERATPLAIGETFAIDSSVLHEKRRINIYFPPGYSAAGPRPLPVLYMPDGGMAEDFLHVAGLVQVSVGNQTMRPFLLVGIENTERRRDMTGPTDNAEDRKIAPRVGGSEAFRRFLRTELMPQVRQRYRTTAETAIVGESLAGLFVIETFLREPDLFDRYIALDPSLWWNSRKLLQDETALLQRGARAGKSLFIASSNEPELAATARQFQTTLEAAKVAGLRSVHQPFPEESHMTIYHPAALRAFRVLLAPAAAVAAAPAPPSAVAQNP